MMQIDAIFRHQSQKDRALFPGADPREFWQRAKDRNEVYMSHHQLHEVAVKDKRSNWKDVPLHCAWRTSAWWGYLGMLQDKFIGKASILTQCSLYRLLRPCTICWAFQSIMPWSCLSSTGHSLHCTPRTVGSALHALC